MDPESMGTNQYTMHTHTLEGNLVELIRLLNICF